MYIEMGAKAKAILAESLKLQRKLPGRFVSETTQHSQKINLYKSKFNLEDD